MYVYWSHAPGNYPCVSEKCTKNVCYSKIPDLLLFHFLLIVKHATKADQM